ncbi:copper homeostasis protein CutC [Paenibacillus sp. JSM ZJ436]|uniref:copper homeostasis protein CutC n=1 Tax=Paenibacillus sp. JSM ZJ436 TaxID=3376190 RepID=UPI0037A29400
MRVKLEVIASTVEDALLAQQHGADRLELITAVTEGGLTPGIGLVRQVLRRVDIPVHVMVRPHSRSFIYSEADLETMMEEIQAISEAGAQGIVLGLLTPEGIIDEEGLQRLLARTGELQVTFHRAFDELEDPLSGIQVLLKYPQVTRVLTAGGRLPAFQSVSRLKQLVEAAHGTALAILAGGGLQVDGIRAFLRQTGVQEVHYGSAVRMDHSLLAPIYPAALQRLVQLLR